MQQALIKQPLKVYEIEYVIATEIIAVVEILGQKNHAEQRNLICWEVKENFLGKESWK